MSTTSNKSGLVLFLMVIASLVFFVTSFLTAAFTNGINNANDADAGQKTTTATSDSAVTGNNNNGGGDYGSDCIFVRTGDGKLFGECAFS